MVMFINGSSYHQFFLAVTICSTQKFVRQKLKADLFATVFDDAGDWNLSSMSPEA